MLYIHIQLTVIYGELMTTHKHEHIVRAAWLQRIACENARVCVCVCVAPQSYNMCYKLIMLDQRQIFDYQMIRLPLHGCRLALTLCS